MILKYYGGFSSIDTLSTLCKTTRNGTSAYYLIKAAEEIGFKAEGIRCDMDALVKEEVVFPCIAHVLFDKTYLHYVVLYEINKKAKYFLIADPSMGIKKISFSDFANIYNHTILTFIPQRNLTYEENTNIFYTTLLSLLREYKKECILFLFLSILFTLFSILTTFYLSSMLDSILYKSNSYLFSIFIIFLLFYLCKLLSQFMRNLILIYIHTKIDFVLTEETFHHILSLPYSYYKNHTTGDVVSRISDLSTIKDIASKFFLFLFVDLLLSFLSLFFLYKIEKTFAFISLLVMIFYLFFSFLFSKKVQMLITSYQKERSNSFGCLFESVNGFESIKGLHLEESVEERYRSLHLKLLEKTNRVTKFHNKIDFLSGFMETSGYLFITYSAVVSISHNVLPTSLLFVSISLYQYFLNPIKNLFLELPSYKEAISSYQRILSLFVKKEEKGFLSYPISGKIEVKNLNFSYLEEHPLLMNLSFRIEKGEKVLLLGKSGVGKSTFLKLLKRYYEGKRGTIFIDEVDIYDYKEEQIDMDICYVSQNETLFTGSLYENIVFQGKKDKWLTEVLKICELDSILKKDSLGIYQLIEEGGYHLSGGEKQRIILARALMKSFSILLVDEGFSELDSILERKILKKLFKAYLQNTILIVSHRMDNMDLYDKVIQFGKSGITIFQKGKNGNYSVV